MKKQTLVIAGILLAMPAFAEEQSPTGIICHRKKLNIVDKEPDYLQDITGPKTVKFFGKDKQKVCELSVDVAGRADILRAGKDVLSDPRLTAFEDLFGKPVGGTFRISTETGELANLEVISEKGRILRYRFIFGNNKTKWTVVKSSLVEE